MEKDLKRKRDSTASSDIYNAYEGKLQTNDEIKRRLFSENEKLTKTLLRENKELKEELNILKDQLDYIQYQKITSLKNDIKNTKLAFDTFKETFKNESQSNTTLQNDISILKKRSGIDTTSIRNTEAVTEFLFTRECTSEEDIMEKFGCNESTAKRIPIKILALLVKKQVLYLNKVTRRFETTHEKLREFYKETFRKNANINTQLKTAFPQWETTNLYENYKKSRDFLKKVLLDNYNYRPKHMENILLRLNLKVKLADTAYPYV